MQPAKAVPGASAVAHSLQPQPIAPSPGNNASPFQPLLYQACREGDVAIVKRLLAAGSIAVNAIDPDTRLTPLMLAAWHGHDDVVFMLTKAAGSADVQLLNSRGDSALSLAAGAGKDEVVELLLFKKAQPDQANHGGRTPLAEAAAGGHLKTAGLLIANGAQVNAGAGTGEPALALAAQRGDDALVGLLLEKKASADVTDRHGWTAFNHAAGRGHEAVMRQLRGHGAAAGHASSTAQEAPAASAPPGPAAVLPPAPQASSTAKVEGGNAAPQASIRTTAITDTTTTTMVLTSPAYAAPSLSTAASGEVDTVLASLRKAVERNDCEALNQIVTRHPDERAVLNQPIAFTRQRGPLPAGSYTLLMLATVHGHVAMVEALLALGAEANARGSGEMTALLLAVRHRQLDVVEILLKAGAEVDAQTADGDTAVMLARARRDAAAVRALLAGVSNPEDISACLRQAAASGYVNTVRLLIRAGAEVNGFEDVKGEKKHIPSYECVRQDWHARDQYGHYYDSQGALSPFARPGWAESLALFRAARNGHTGIVRMLLDAGARLDRGYDSQELMLDALQNGHIDIMRMLLEGRSRASFPYSRGGNDNDFVKTDMEKVFTYAINGNKLGILQALLDMPEGKAAVPRTPAALNAAVQRSNLEIARKLLDAGADPNKPAYNQYPVVLAVESGNRKMLEMLIKADAIPELALQHGNDKATLLQHAVRRGHREIVQIILSLDAGAHCDKADVSEALALNGAMSCAQLLLDAGADPNWKGKNGRTALSQAVSGGNKAVVELLLRHKAQVDLAFASGSIELTPLADAAYRGHTGIVRLLLESGADRTLKDSEGKTAVHRAIESNNKEVVDLLRNWKPNASS
ncbi:ankyrin repeat domain-containing protein [Noviherbaspirillum sp. 1P10PC]|uniref:ankyrin repeat domain-containing protein n=1 Tax=Noviherbaspirillum sp. 1P10PC TaxID=3132292 RepID=UPI00399FA7F9